MDKKIGFLGAGNMCQAIAGGMIASGTVPVGNIYASARTEAGLQKAKDMGITTTLDNCEIVKQCSVIFIAVKPHILPGVLKQLAPLLTTDHFLISVANMVTNKEMEDLVGKPIGVMRTLPNTPVKVQSGVIVAYPGSHCTPKQTALCKTLMEPLGLFSILPSEPLIDVASGLCGSSPAFLFIMIDAMADAGVRMGLPRGVAVNLAAQTMQGSAKMVLQEGENPIQLANNVCSPGGTTIEGVYRLSRAGFKGTVMDAVIGACEKTQGKEMRYNY